MNIGLFDDDVFSNLEKYLVLIFQIVNREKEVHMQEKESAKPRNAEMSSKTSALLPR